MLRRSLFLSLTIAIFFVCAPSHAQIKRDHVFVEGQFRTAAYSGERGNVGSNRLAQLFNAMGPGGSVALGYQIWDAFDLVGEVSISSYDNITAAGVGLKGIDPDKSSIYHTAVSGSGRLRLLPFGPFEPFFIGGLGLTIGRINGSQVKGFGPIAGLGIGIPVGRFKFVSSASQHYVFPNRGIDLAGTGRMPDVLSAINFGIQYHFKRRIPKIAHVQVSGPSSLDVNSAGLFEAFTDLDPVEYAVRWDFGDGTTATGLAVRHAFENEGTYQVRVHISNIRGSSTTTLDVRVDPVYDRVVLLSLSIEPNTIVRGDRVSFTPIMRGNDISCSWSFGDGSSADTCSANHVFPRSGNYKITFIAANPHHTAHASQVISVLNDACAELPSLSSVYFPANSSNLTLEMRQILRENMSTSSACVERVVEIVGRALSNERNPVELASERAAQVYQYYRNLGMSFDRVLVSPSIISPADQIDELPWNYRSVSSALIETRR